MIAYNVTNLYRTNLYLYDGEKNGYKCEDLAGKIKVIFAVQSL